MTPYFFVLPESFDPGEFLKSPELQCRFDDARYLMSVILKKLAYRDVDESGVVRLRAEYLDNIMRSTTSKAVRDALLDGGAIQRFAYAPGDKSFGFLPAPRFGSDRHVRVLVKSARLIRRLTAFHNRQTAESRVRMLPVHIALNEHQKRLRIHGAGARRALRFLPNNCNPFDAQGILISAIENREFHSDVSRFGRMFNNITSLKRELRQFLHVGGKKLVNVDLTCSQPTLLAKVIRETSGTKGNGSTSSIYDSRFGPDLDRYASCVQNGSFYDVLVTELDGRMNREQVKRRFLADVIAKRKIGRGGREYPSIVEDAFRRLFPSVYAFVRSVNRDGWEHANLIRILQRAESELVIETVAEDLVTRFPKMFCLTLHDAIYTTDQHLCEVEKAFRRAFDRTGFQMQFKISA